MGQKHNKLIHESTKEAVTETRSGEKVYILPADGMSRWRRLLAALKLAKQLEEDNQC